GFAFDRHAENLCRCGCAHAHSSQLRSRTHRARLWQFGVPLFGGNAGVRRGGPDIDQPDERRADAASRTHRGSLGVAGVVAAWKFDLVDSHRSAGGYSFGDRLPMFDSQIFRLLFQKSGRLDFAVIAVVIAVALSRDLIAAAGVGIGMAILLFIRDQVRGSVIRRKRYLDEISSKTQRSEGERAILRSFGDQGVGCELQGNLFFGTTDQLFSQLESDLRTKRFILMDMRRVRSIDYTAVRLLEQMHQGGTAWAVVV